MKILNISHTDYANFQYENMKALQSVGLHCDSFVLQPHEFYEEQSLVIDIRNLLLIIPEYDVIQFFHDNTITFGQILPYIKKKTVIAYHTSSYYRANHASVNALMNPYVAKSVNAMPEFMAMGAKNPVYMVGAVDTNKIKPAPTNNQRLLFAHYPSNPKVKGTDKIIELMAQTNVDFVYSTELVSHKEQLERISKCDVYIEMFTKEDGFGSPYGNFGITALEAAAMGKSVVTNFRDYMIYKKNYGFNPFLYFHQETDEQFIKTIHILNQELSSWVSIPSRNWVEKNHSHKATGKYFLKNVLNG